MHPHHPSGRTPRALRVTAASLALFTLMIPQIAGAAGEPAPAVVSQDSVTTRPYPIALDPNGEFRVIHFNTGLVKSALVAKPWLITVLIEGSDVVLQAKATTGSTQLVVYVGDTGTLWQIDIATHGAAAMRIVVTPPGEPAPAPAAGRSSPTTGSPTPAPETSAGATNPELTAFLNSLSPELRAGFAAWRRDPSGGSLSTWIAQLSDAQRAQFNALVQRRVVGISAPSATAGPTPPPGLVDTTTVISPRSAVLPVPVTPSPAAAPPVPAAPRAAADAVLHTVVKNAAEGVRIAAVAISTGDGVQLRYTIQNDQTVELAGPTLSVTDGIGHAVQIADKIADHIPPSGQISGVIALRSQEFPIVMRWRWEQRSTGTVWFIHPTISRGATEFVIVVTQ